MGMHFARLQLDNSAGRVLADTLGQRGQVMRRSGLVLKQGRTARLRPTRAWMMCGNREVVLAALVRRTGRNVPHGLKRPLMPMSVCRPGWPVVPPRVAAWLGFGG